MVGVMYVCVLHLTVLSTRRHPGTTSVRADSSTLLFIIREMRALWSPNRDTEMLRCSAVSRVAQTMQCHVIVLDTTGATYMLLIAVQMS